MAYTVLALKWRPQGFDDLIGQARIVTTLKNSIQSNRLAHAFLFAGPRGVGKTSCARILAKALNCLTGPAVCPCQKCPSCLDITRGNSLDVIEVDGASNRGIDEIRALRENVKFPAVSAKFKIYIIDEVHMLTTEAFNALLKTLEEPPPFVKFIFATTQPNKVLPTILSRCHRFDFRRISVMEIAGQLEKISRGEGIELDKKVLFAIAKSSDGSLRDAESLLDQLASFALDKISLADVTSMLGAVELETIFEITDTLIHKDALRALELLDSILDSGKDVSVLLSSLIEHFRNLMVVKVSSADSSLLDLPQDFCQRLADQAGKFRLDEIFHSFTALLNAQEMSKRMDSLRIPLEICLVRLAHNKETKPTPVAGGTKPEENIPVVEKKPHVLRKSDESIRQAAVEKSDEPPQLSPHKISLEVITGAWLAVIEAVSKSKMSIATYLTEGEIVSLEGNLLSVSFPKNCSLHKESLEKRENKALIEQVITHICRITLKLNFILSKEESAPRKAPEAPFLKSAIDAFDARLI